MMKQLIVSFLVMVLSLMVIGCAPRGYAPSSVGQSMRVEPGVVESVREVTLDNNGVGNTIGGIVGSVAGAAAGAQVGGGTGRVVATVFGTAIGGVAGGTVGDRLDTDYGQEVVVRLNSGRTVATVLRINGATQALRPGEAVNVFFSGNRISNISPR